MVAVYYEISTLKKSRLPVQNDQVGNAEDIIEETSEQGSSVEGPAELAKNKEEQAQEITKELLEDMVLESVQVAKNIFDAKRKKGSTPVQATPTEELKPEPAKTISPLSSLPSLLKIAQKPSTTEEPKKSLQIHPTKVLTDKNTTRLLIEEFFASNKMSSITLSDNLTLLDPSIFIQTEKQRSTKNENQQIYNKLVFDIVNELIGGLIEKSKPWSSSRLPKSQASTKVVDYVKQQIGSILGPETFAMDNISQIIEKEQKSRSVLIDTTKEEHQIKIEVSEKLFDELLLDTINEVDAVMKRKLSKKR